MVSSSDNFTTPAEDDTNTWARRVADILLGFGPNDSCSNRGEPVNTT